MFVERAWIGLTDQVQEGTFEWTSGETFDPNVFSGFSGTEPNNGGGIEHYVTLSQDGTWSDLLDDTFLPAIIEFDSVPDIVAINDHFSETGILLIRNAIGVDQSGTSALPNAGDGLRISASGNVEIGRAVALNLGRNTISGNGGYGISITNGSHNIAVPENLVGISSSTSNGIGNTAGGVLIQDATSVSIGPGGLSVGNEISQNLGNGISVAGSSSEIRIDGNDMISGNGGHGISVTEQSAGVNIADNRIYDNAGLGIDLGDDGVTENDQLDVDEGPNGHQNSPTLLSVVHELTSSTIHGNLHSTPLTEFRVNIFRSSSTTAAAEGEMPIVNHSVTTDENGNAMFSVATTQTLSPGQVLTATATDPAGNTSEFSSGLVVSDDVDLRAVAFDVAADTLPGGVTNVTFTVRNTGSVAASAFVAQLIWSPNNVGGDDDDIVVGTDVAFDDLAAGAETTRTTTVNLNQPAVYAAVSDLLPPNPSSSDAVAGVSHLFVSIDAANEVAETNEFNNAGQGLTIDSDDVIHLPWDIDNNGTVTPLDALHVIRAINTADAVSDFDGNGFVTPLEALAALQRIGYRRVSDAAKNKTLGESPSQTKTVLSAFPSPGKTTSIFTDEESLELPPVILTEKPDALQPVDHSFEDSVDWLSII